jgi:hypothetical protein
MTEHKQLDNANRERQATPPHGDPLDTDTTGSREERKQENALNALPEVPDCPPAPPEGPGRESV